MSDHLVCDAKAPLVSRASLQEELLLYCLSPVAVRQVLAEFCAITGKPLCPDSNVLILSGGQKVLLMSLLALHSPARKILFTDLWHALDPHFRQELQSIIDRIGQDKEIIFRETAHAD